MSLKWYFLKPHPDNPNHGSGPNDSGIEHFKGEPIKGVIRESIQNSLDAVDDKNKKNGHVEVVFEFGIIDKNNIPDLEELKRHIALCGAQYNNYKKESEEALKVLSKTKVPYLRISDKNTKGASGVDDDGKSDWYRLIYSPGDCDKPESSGGSFGIGKSSYFALSHPRAVFFSTQDMHKKTAFIGLTRQARHNDKNQKLLEIGYLTYEKTKSTRTIEKIPSEFQRTEPGLDIFIIGVRGDYDENVKEALSEVCANFYLAITEKKLIVKINDLVGKKEHIISDKTLSDIFERHAAFAKQSYLCFRSTQIGEEYGSTLKTIGACKLHLLTNEVGLPQRIAFFRRGMLIYMAEFRFNLPFAGTFFCDNSDGNSLLRKLEPPQHNSWEPKRDPKNGNQAIEEIREWIRDILRKAAGVGDDSAFSLTELSDLMPFSGDESSGKKENDKGGVKTDFPKRGRRDADIKLTELPVSVERFHDFGHEEGPGAGSGGGGGGIGGGGGEGGGGGGEKDKYDPLKISSNSCEIGAKGIYKVWLKSERNHSKVFLRFAWIAEDGSKDYIVPLGVIDANGRDIKISNEGLVGPLRIEGKVPNIYNIKTGSSKSYGLAVGAFLPNE
jgi:uncharacterized membrane protein YgcG